ncbi:YczE/YyaS/YitT family protein [Bacillus sp. REN16]|uniref:YczE/YyaS/YitT family protein n=1 Tax=Bacillus sp. REN16 TaxID=2887296 RepID=UPI001E54E5F5|nr:BCR, YitT family protein [Bacillus sp. REN16]MCC3357896.1 BCR, YitT family protein [Bacillus sp. REN16]
MTTRIGIYLGGLALTALGIALIIKSFIGAGPWDTVAVGLTNHLGLTIGTWSILTQITFTMITWILEKTRLRIESVIPIFIRSVFVDFWFYIVLGIVDFTSALELQIVSFVGGLVFAGIGIGIYMEANLPKTPIDGMMVAISNRFSLSFQIVRMGIEVTGAVLGFIVGGPVGIGTLVIALLLGKIIQVVNNRMKRIMNESNTTVSI